MHPILSNRKSQLYFFLAWILLTAIHVIILISLDQAKIQPALTDGIVFYLLLGILAIGLWYPIKFIQSGDRKDIALVINNIGIGTLSLFLWLTASYFVLEALLGEDTEYMAFLNKSMPWRAVAGLLIYLVLLLVYYLIINYTDLQEKIRLEGNLKTLVKESELNMLKSQINPHFLFNSLNSINSLILSDSRKAQNMIIKLSEFLRYALKYHQKDKTRLNEELYNINLYLDIEKIRFGKKLLFENNIPETYGEYLLPNMILQPLIENAIKHGVYESTEEVTIKLDAETSEDILNITVSNNYDPESPGKKGAGMGLRNVQNRMFLIYNRNDLFRYNKENDMFIAHLSIPAEEHME